MEGPTYSNPLRVTYSFGSIAFTAAIAHQLLPPPGRNWARVVDIHVRATVTFTNVTTGALVNLGTVASAARYATLNCAATAAATSINLGSAGGTPYNEASVIFQKVIDLANDGTAFVQAQVVAPTGGSPAGTGYLDITLAWW
jgi:hypothetical protein